MARARSRRLTASYKRQSKRLADPSARKISAEKRKGREERRPTEDNSAYFEEYYQRQSLLDGRGFVALLRALRQPLPMTFRVNEATADARLLKRCKGEPCWTKGKGRSGEREREREGGWLTSTKERSDTHAREREREKERGWRR
jgi:16S rRNA C967 or C1407 C5-methylase (RsmB/RsmF family)